MPRPVDPKFGFDGFEIEPEPFVVQNEQIDQLFSILRIPQTNEKRSLLHDQLIRIGTSHRRYRRRGPRAFNRAEAGKALRILIAQDRISGADVRALNERAFQMVYDQLLTMKILRNPAGVLLLEMLDANRVDHRFLLVAARKALGELQSRKGADDDNELASCVFQLCRLYERLSRQRVTLSNKEQRIYTRKAGSTSARFIYKCYEMIDADIPDHRLNGFIRRWVEDQA